MSDQNICLRLRSLLRPHKLAVRVWRRPVSAMLGLAFVAGCASTSPAVVEKSIGNDTCEVDSIMQQVDNPSPPVYSDVKNTPRPVSAEVLAKSDLSYDDQTLSQVLHTGLANSSVLRDIGGTILRTPEVTATTLNRQLVQTDPRYGSEAALSAFDAQLSATANFNNNDRIYNNSFFAGGASAFVQDFNDYQVELSKRTATGSLLAVRSVTNYDNNNAPANTFRSAWDSWVEGEMRQPLLQGGGLEFNRIAGPGSTPGVYNGVLIAKVNSDISDADFQVSLRDYVSNVENAYWDLYLAFREYDAKKKAYEQINHQYNERYVKNPASDKKLEASMMNQQVLQLKTEMDEALFGKLMTGTQVRNGATGGTMQSGGGVLGAERRLRLLIGRPATDGMVIRPVDEPTMAEVTFMWEAAIEEAVTQRPELQKQNNAVKKRELELLAAKNFLNPRLDAVGKYRFRGFGDDLIADGFQGGTAPASSVGNLMTGNQQEWAVGVELTIPIGYRKAHAAVSHAELNLARERTIQREQQREIISNLSGAFTDVERTYLTMKNTLDQYIAARQYFDATVNAKAETGGTVEAERLLDANRRLVHAETQFFRARAEYAIALKNVHYEKGSLMSYKDLRISQPTSNIDAAPVPEVPAETPMAAVPEVPEVPVEPMKPAKLKPVTFKDSAPQEGSSDIKPISGKSRIDDFAPENQEPKSASSSGNTAPKYFPRNVR